MFEELARELISLFGRGVDEPLSDGDFQRLALAVFRHQYRTNPVYAGFCRGREATPGAVDRWEDVPPVPTRAFKRLRLVSAADPDAVDAVFRTSGTTRGSGRKGEHHVPDLRLYRASVLPNFRAYLLPDGARLPLVSLIPSPRRAPDSSLSHMIDVVARELCAGEPGWFVDPEEGIRERALLRALRELEEEGRPGLVVGTAFAFVHWMDAMDREGWRVGLPPGTRIMETGGFKGRSRTLGRDELYEGVRERLGVPPGRIVNEYGMTELLSQFYEPHLRRLYGSDPRRSSELRRRHVPPPWLRTRVLDPTSLEPVAPGERGLLCHYDLANLGSVMGVLTEDVGVAADDGFRVLGRAGDAEPRGCSLAMDELLSVAEAGP